MMPPGRVASICLLVVGLNKWFYFLVIETLQPVISSYLSIWYGSREFHLFYMLLDHFISPTSIG